MGVFRLLNVAPTQLHPNSWTLMQAFHIVCKFISLTPTSEVCVPLYRKELLLKLQRLHQGPRTVDEYFKDLETTLTKINMHDSEESMITRFVSGLRRDIKDVVELYEYYSLKKLVQLDIKVESHILTKTTIKTTHRDDFYKSSGKDKNNISTTTLISVNV